jgi:hypothetical protein
LASKCDHHEWLASSLDSRKAMWCFLLESMNK